MAQDHKMSSVCDRPEPFPEPGIEPEPDPEPDLDIEVRELMKRLALADPFPQLDMLALSREQAWQEERWQMVRDQGIFRPYSLSG